MSGKILFCIYGPKILPPIRLQDSSKFNILRMTWVMNLIFLCSWASIAWNKTNVFIRHFEWMWLSCHVYYFYLFWSKTFSLILGDWIFNVFPTKKMGVVSTTSQTFTCSTFTECCFYLWKNSRKISHSS